MLIVIAALALGALAACHSHESAGEQKPGTGTLKVTVKAVPKDGVHAPGADYDKQGSGPPRINYDGLDGIVVYREWMSPPHVAHEMSAPPGFSVEQVRLKLTDAGFEPLLAALPQNNMPLAIENGSSKPATIYSVSNFDTGALSPGETKFVVLKAGLTEVLVEDGDARATVFAAKTWFPMAVLRSGDSFSWKGVPPGDHVVHAWHKRFPESQKTVTVKPDETTEVTLELGVNALPKIDNR